MTIKKEILSKLNNDKIINGIISYEIKDHEIKDFVLPANYTKEEYSIFFHDLNFTPNPKSYFNGIIWLDDKTWLCKNFYMDKWHRFEFKK